MEPRFNLDDLQAFLNAPEADADEIDDTERMRRRIQQAGVIIEARQLGRKQGVVPGTYTSMQDAPKVSVADTLRKLREQTS